MKQFNVGMHPNDFGVVVQYADFDRHPELRGTRIEMPKVDDYQKPGLFVLYGREEATALMDALWQFGYRPSKEVAPEAHRDVKLAVAEAQRECGSG